MKADLVPTFARFEFEIPSNPSLARTTTTDRESDRVFKFERRKKKKQYNTPPVPTSLVQTLTSIKLCRT